MSAHLNYIGQHKFNNDEFERRFCGVSITVHTNPSFPGFSSVGQSLGRSTCRRECATARLVIDIADKVPRPAPARCAWCNSAASSFYPLFSSPNIYPLFTRCFSLSFHFANASHFFGEELRGTRSKRGAYLVCYEKSRNKIID